MRTRKQDQQEKARYAAKAWRDEAAKFKQAYEHEQAFRRSETDRADSAEAKVARPGALLPDDRRCMYSNGETDERCPFPRALDGNADVLPGAELCPIHGAPSWQPRIGRYQRTEVIWTEHPTHETETP